MAIFDDGTKAFLEAYTYFSNLLGKGMEKTAKKFAEEATGVKAPEKLEPVIPGNEVIRIPSKVEKSELMSINSTFSDPLKSDLVLSKIDGTAGSKYSVLRSETERMFPQFTQDLQYIKDNNIALTTVQKNNIINNLRLKRSLQTEVKKLETNLIADKKDPQMIFQAYTSASSKSSKLGYQQSTYPEGVERGSMAAKAIDESEIYKKNQLLNKKRLEEGQEMFKGFEPKVIEGGKGITPVDDGTKGIDDLFDKDGVLDKDAVLRDITETLTPKKAGQGKYTKAEVLIARLENTLKTSKDPYVQKKFPGFIEEIKAKPELANNKKVFDTLGGPLPKNQRLVEYDDGTVDFFQKTDFGPQNIPPTQKLAQELGISIEEASAILKMEPEDQVLEIGRRKALSDRIDNLVDDTLSEEPTSLYDENFDDYFKPDDKPKQAKGGIISLT
jgi:hypothetical protein